MPFAGHPTLGTAHVARDLLGTGDSIRLDMKAGVIPVTAEGDVWTLETGAPRLHAPDVPRGQLAAMLGLEAADVRDGALWVDEDPGTGSACANLGGWLVASGAALPLALAVSQGDEVGRPCRLRLRVDADTRIFVSGRVIEPGRGAVSL